MNLEKFEKYNVKRIRNEISAEEVMAGSGPAQSMDSEDNFGEVESSLHRKRILWVGAAAAIAIFFFASRVFYLQIIRGGSYKQEAADNRIKRVPVEAARGIIFTKDGKQLVSNSPVFDLAANAKLFPSDKEGRENLAKNILVFLGRKELADADSKILEDISNLIRAFSPEKSSLIIYKDIPRELALVIEANQNKFQGLEIIEGTARFYLEKEKFSHILGYIDSVSKSDLKKNSGYLPTESIGKSGIEMWYENSLKGSLGTQLIEVDSSGNRRKVLAAKDPIAGNDLILSIDYNLQDKIYSVLKEKISEVHSSKACAIALNPKTGEILAMASLPSFDNNIFSGSARRGEYQRLVLDLDKPLFNRVISGEYPPGSIVKPLVASAALEEKIITDKTVVEDRGVISIASQYAPNTFYNFYGWNRGGLGAMNVYSAIAQSSDIFFYTVGGGNSSFKGMGVDLLNKYFYKFGLGSKLGVDLPGESAGMVPTSEWKKRVKNEDWYLGDTYHISIGQGDLLATPLQAAVWMAAIANNGVAMKPHIGLRIIGGDGKKSLVASEVLFDLNFNRKNFGIVQKAMRQSVTEGSASLLSSLPIKIAGKTGTAEYGSGDETHAWFACFAPYDDPQIVLVVLVEGGGGGAAVAVPITKEILEYWGVLLWR